MLKATRRTSRKDCPGKAVAADSQRRNCDYSRWEVMQTWNQGLAEVMVTKVQMWEMSFKEENKTSFSSNLDEQQ